MSKEFMSKLCYLFEIFASKEQIDFKPYTRVRFQTTHSTVGIKKLVLSSFSQQLQYSVYEKCGCRRLALKHTG